MLRTGAMRGCAARPSLSHGALHQPAPLLVSRSALHRHTPPAQRQLLLRSGGRHDTQPLPSNAPLHADPADPPSSAGQQQAPDPSPPHTPQAESPSPLPPQPSSSFPPTPSSPPSTSPSFPPGLQFHSVLPSTSTFLPSPSPSPSTSTKPYMLLLPDLDGAGMTSRRSWAALSDTFDLQVLTLSPTYAPPPSSTSPFKDLLSHVTLHLRTHLANSPQERPTYLLGEGFGAVLALAAALDCPDIIQRLLLVNPSTSYLTSPMRHLEPLLQSGFPSPLELGLALAVAPALVATIDPMVAATALLESGGRRPERPSPSSSSSQPGAGGLLQRAVAGGLELLRRGPVEVAGETLKLARATLEEVKEVSVNLPPGALKQRLRMLGEGVRVVESRLGEVEQRTMVLVGGRDPVLPSEEEGKRLAKQMQRAFLKVLPNSGRCPLSEPEVDVLEIMRQEGFLTQRRVFTSEMSGPNVLLNGSSFGGARPLEVPSLQEVQRAGAEWTSSIRSYCSPVFFSTLEDGTIVEGLEGLPADERPLLVVGNHQLYAFDMNIMVEEVLLKRGLLLRGLAHPSLFDLTSRKKAEPEPGAEAEEGKQQQQQQQQSEGLPRNLSITYQTFGAVEVSAKNFYKLLRQKEAVLLYPGGVREGFKRKQEKYELFWPSKPEFVRMAARFSSTVVPLSAVGLEDSISLVLDSDELLSNPLLGARSREMSEATRLARSGVSEDPDHDQSFVPPIIAPQIPARLYFLFGRPVKLERSLYDDRPAAQRVYSELRGAVEGGIGWLLRKREQDPYKDFLPRYLYENPPLGGSKRKAPTFSPK